MDVEIETFQKLLDKRGTANLNAFQLGSDGPHREFYFWLSKRDKMMNNFLWVANDQLWSKQLERELIDRVLAIVKTLYGYSSHMSASVPVNGSGTNYSYITTSDSDLSKMLSVF